jgi:hypothetical protein
VLAPELLTSQGRALSHQTTRVTQKVKEAELTWSKLKGKGKVKVNDQLFDEVWSEKLGILKAKRVAIQPMIVLSCDKPLGIDLGPEYVADCFVPKADTSLVLSRSLFIIDCELCTR